MSDRTDDTQFDANDLKIDLKRQRVEYRGKNIYLSDLLFRMLACIHAAAPDVVQRGTILDTVWGHKEEGVGDTNVDKARARLNLKLLPFGLEIRNEPHLGYRIDRIQEEKLPLEIDFLGPTNREYPADAMTDFNIERLNSTPPASTADPSSDTFTFLIDGMIIDTVVELLKHHETMVPIINRSRATYKRGIEDFAFSIVYASSITCSTDMVVRSNDPVRFSRSEILSQLGRLWVPHELDHNLKKGKILENADHRERVREYVEAAGRCVMGFDWAFRDWFLGEVSRHIGEDESLFEEGLPPDRLKFKNQVLFNYRYPDLQAALGVEATNRAVTILREATSGSRRPYTTSCLHEFATTNIVGLVTVMREYDISAENKNIWRMPHLLRSLITQDVIFDSNLQQQIHLRGVITRHAMAAALRQVDDVDRQSLLTVLVNMRNESPFKEIREILVEYKLLLSQPRPEDESTAKFILNEIARLADSDSKDEPSDRFTLAQRKALRALDQADSDQYVDRLYRVFPALNPTMAPRPS